MVSRFPIEYRTLTPLRWLIWGECRSSAVRAASVSFMNGGTRTGTPPVGRRASWSMIETSSPSVSG